jgi:hypothetical protein
VALPVPAMPTAAQAVALGAKYGPQSAMAFQRSQYLADALERMQADTNNIRTPQALWADLLAEGITGWSKSRADKDAMAAYGADQKTLHDNLTAGTPLDPSYQPPAGGGSLMSGDAMMPPPPSAAAPSPRAVGPTTPQDPQGRDLLARMILGEAGGEGDVGERAAGHVAMNRVASGWGGAHTLADVISAPHQFEGLHSAQARSWAARTRTRPTARPSS